MTNSVRSDIVFYRNNSITGIGIVGSIKDGQHDIVGTIYIGATIIGIVEDEVGDRTVVGRAIVHELWVYGNRTVLVKLHRNVLAVGNRGNRIVNGNIGSTGADVAIKIGNGQGHGIGDVEVRTVEGGIVNAQTGNSTCVAGVVVHSRRGSSCIARTIQLKGQVTTDGVGSHIVFDRNDSGTS